MKHRLILAAAVAVSSACALAADYGYCTDAVQRTNIFRLGDTETQGLAIRLDASKLAMLKGRSITAIKTAFGSSRTNDGNARLFIATAPDAEPLASLTAKIPSAVKWVEFPLDAPYTIKGDEGDLYIGYTADINTRSSMLMSDYTADLSGCCYAYRDGTWVDTYGLGYGNALIRIILDGNDDITDLLIKPVAASGYFKAGTGYKLGAQLYNFGDTEIHSFDAVVTVGDTAPKTLSYTDVTISKGTTFDITLPEFKADAEGNMPLSIEITNINGATDADAADNAFATDMYFYPSAMERSFLLEGFTGQECSNCPAGHTTVHNFLQSATEVPVIEVMHHAGYAPDFMSMDADLDYTYFYGSPSTFAPACMFNRAVIPQIGNVPVMNVSTSNLTTAYNALLATQPYVSLALETAFDAATRCVDVKVKSLTHTDMPTTVNVLNVMLAQDGVVHSQKPYGEGYVHNGVFRGVLTGNSWGLQLDESSCVAGGKSEWSTSFTLPEAIFSDYWASAGVTDEQKIYFSIPTVPDNMYIVAYVGAFDNTDLAGHTVYNAVKVPLGSSYAQGGIASTPTVGIDNTDGPVIVISGRSVLVQGEVDYVEVVTIDGRRVDASAPLAPGAYVVRAVRGDKVSVKKTIIR